MSDASPSACLSRDIIPRAKFWVEVDGQYAFGRGISRILKAVEETGSIKAAAAQLGKSYRFAWARIKEAEQTIGAPLVLTRIGGNNSHRSDLTDLARDLVRDFDALYEQMAALVHREFQQGLISTLQRHRPNE